MKKISNRTIKRYQFTIIISKLLKKTKLVPNSIQKKFNNNRQEKIVELLSVNYKDVIDKFKNKKEKVTEKNNVVWLFWWQGIDFAPYIVKCCYKRIEERCKFNNKKLIVIDKFNFKNYVTIPDYIMEKFENEKQIPTFHFADIIRVSLLYNYGGLWMDATDFISNDYDFNELNYDFYTVKAPNDEWFDVSHGKWAAFALESYSHSISFEFIYEFLLDYWKHNNEMIDYFLIDYVMRIAYVNNIGNFRIKVDSCDNYLPNVFLFIDKMDKKMDYNDFENDLNKSKFYKLTYKFKNKSGNDRVFRRFEDQIK